MRSILSSVLLSALFLPPAYASENVGVRDVAIPSPLRGKDLAVTVWYPTDAKGENVHVGDNRIFEGAAALKNAAFEPGHHPLVLLSHGSGSRGIGMAWIATELARAGFIVAAPDHPGTTSGDSTPEDTPKIWERTDDLSTIITSLTTNAEWSASIDANRIGVMGFSLGGSAALELVGARADLGAYVQYCVDYAQSMDCTWFSGGRGYKNGELVQVPPLDLRSVDKARFEQSNHDHRIRAAVLVDPGLEVAFTKDSLEDINIPLTFINLGSAGTIPVSVLSDQLAKKVPNGTYAQVDDADHFSFLPVCKPDAEEFLKTIGEIDPICTQTGLRNRADLHAELARMIVDAFQTSLKASQ